MAELGELSAHQQGKSSELETTRKRKQTSIFRWLKNRGSLIYLTAALSAATPFKHERLEAAEISPGSTWSEGIQTLRNGVLSGKVETQGTFYIDNQTNRRKWIFGQEDKFIDIPDTGKEIEKAVERELSAHPTQSVTVCSLHTHPLSAAEATGFISAEESRNVREGKHSVSIPPSGSAAEIDGDISLWHTGTVESAFKKFRENGVTVEARRGVVDAAGITYYRPINDQEIKQEFQGIFAEVEQSKTVLHKWKETISPLVDNLDTATLNTLHSRTRNALKYLMQESSSEEKKRRDVKEALITGWIVGGIESEDIARLFFENDLKGQKLQHDFKTQVIDKRRSDMGVLDRARFALTKISMTVDPEQLPFTKEYTKLREAYARNAIYIRFIPHSDVPNEPPCSGTDYKP